MAAVGWRAAMQTALYGPDGFFVRADTGPADHFRTSVHASPLFAGALLRLLADVDAALGHPPHLDVVDVGAGRGELLSAMLALDPPFAARMRCTGVEVRHRPPGLDRRIGWRPDVPDGVVGLLLATEWLDNVPLDVVEVDDDGRLRQVRVDPATGAETLGGAPTPADMMWLARWNGRWRPGMRIEVGWPRDVVWADAVSAIRRGAALAVDYGHVRTDRPPHGTLTGFRGGRQVPPVPDGGCDVTAHVAMDSAACAAGVPYALLTQREALKSLGVSGARPPLDLARSDPAAYLRALSAAGSAAELLEPAGLGGHRWLVHRVGIEARGIVLG